VLAGRVEVGSISGAAASMLPTSRLYFAGGGGSIRGYAHKNVGPRLADGTVVGGRSLFEASAELRIKVTETIGVVPFVDTGNAFSATLPDFSQPLKTGAGVGVRYDTGLGPLRLDVAVPLDPAPDDPDYGIYIGLGQAF
jgi:translocation and assembly module TamA